MALIEEIKRMEIEGKTEQEIIDALQHQGIPPQDIIDALSQVKIKQAVTNGAETPAEQLSYESEERSEQTSPPTTQETYAPQQPSYPEYEQYESHQQGGISADTINEIAEQVVIEKLSPLRNKIEEILSFKTSIDAKIEYLDERLKKIEKIIDRLQLSILQKVGSYVTNVEDIKHELQETQKSFKTLIEQHHKHKS